VTRGKPFEDRGAVLQRGSELGRAGGAGPGGKRELFGRAGGERAGMGLVPELDIGQEPEWGLGSEDNEPGDDVKAVLSSFGQG
jgi:hypothetical protein